MGSHGVRCRSGHRCGHLHTHGSDGGKRRRAVGFPGFVIAAIACGLAALCYAEFASTVPVAGSAYTFSYATFGEFVAWIIGWDLILEFALASSVVAKGWSLYLGEVMGSRSPIVELGPISFDWGAVLVIAVITILLATGTKLSSRVSLVITAIKVAVVLLVIIVGLFYIDTDNYSPYIPPSEPGSTGEGIHQSLFSYVTGAGGSTFGWYGLLAAASLVFFAFIGFDVVATTAEEAKEAAEGVATRHPGLALDRHGSVRGSDTRVDRDGEVHRTRGRYFQPGNGIRLPRHHLGEKRHLVRRVGRSHDRGDGADARADQGALRDGTRRSDAATPGADRQARNSRADHDLGRRCGRGARRSVPIGTLEEMVNIGTLFAFVLVSLGVLVLRRTRPDLPRGFRVPLVPLIPILAVLACLWLMFNLSVETWMRFVVWMALGVVVYFAYSRQHSLIGKRERGEIE